MAVYTLDRDREATLNHNLIKKYDVAGPRYTSYPTALQFNDDFEIATLQRIAQENYHSEVPLSLYIHVPFCRSICYYCACNKIVTRKHHEATEYLNYLCREIEMVASLYGNTRPVTQLHFGGGTPTYLSNAELTELMHCLAKNFNLLDSEQREYSIELDPRTVDDETIALLKGLGFNRLSLGIQDFDQRVQEAVNRIQPLEKVRSLVKAIRKHEFKSISFDLIYGLPHQTSETIAETIKAALSLEPDRISYYNYAHMPERFSSQRAIDRLTLPSAAEKLEMLETIMRSFAEAGYLYVGMDHFVKPDDELAIAQREGHLQRNFQGYSTCLAPDLVGMGVSAISSVGNCFAQNEKEIEAYYKRIDDGQPPISVGLELTEDDLVRRAVIMAIICDLKVIYSDLDSRFGISFTNYFASELNRLTEMEADGLLRIHEDRLEITEVGRRLLRNICMVFDIYFTNRANPNQKVHSKTI
jgi:oxygen-independent coproporphyrinogen-3 oxidase